MNKNQQEYVWMHKMSPIDNSTKTMIAGKVFRIKPQEYKGNAVLNANTSNGYR